MTRSLTAKSVSYAYESGRFVFSGVDLEISTGEVVGVVGPNGAGKSTLLRVLCGLLKPATGAVTFDGKPIASLSPRERARKTAFLPQAVNPAFSLSVFEVVCLGRYPHVGALGALLPRDREVAERCMRDTEITALRSRDFTALSGGERQRVLLASILAQEPDLLLLDEPTSALDIHHQMEIFSMLRRLSREGYGVAAVTHDLNLAARFCDRVALMTCDHEMLDCGAPASVFTEEKLSRAYGARIRVGEHPADGAPLVWAEPPGESNP